LNLKIFGNDKLMIEEGFDNININSESMTSKEISGVLGS
jgi:hypothetical protein